MEDKNLVKKDENQNTNLNENTNLNNTSKSNKSMMAFLIILVIIMAIALFYFIFIKKDNSGEKKENNSNTTTETSTPTPPSTVPSSPTPTPTESSKPTSSSNVTTYTTKDGKKTLKLYGTSNQEMNKKAREQLKKNDNDYSDEGDYFIENGNSLGEYNGKLVVIYSYGNDKEGDYTTYVGDLLGEGSQCGSYFFIVKDNKELVDFQYELNSHYFVSKIGNNYYFGEQSSCVGPTSAFYTESKNKIGDVYLEEDSKNNFYVIDKGIVVKYDSNLNIVSKGEKYFKVDKIYFNDGDEWDGDPYVIGDSVYFLYFDDGFTDDNEDDYIKIYESKTDTLYNVVKNDGTLSIRSFKLDSTKTKLETTFYGVNGDDVDYDKTIVYVFDSSTKTITKK